MSNATLSLMAGASRFAHLVGLARPSRASAEEDENQVGKKKGAADDEGDGDGDETDDADDRDNKEGAKKKGAAPEDDQGDDGADDENNGGDGTDQGDDGTEPDGEKGEKKGRADDKPACDDEDPDEEMRGNSAAAKARRRENARCAAIFACPAAAKNPALAASLAFETRLPRAEAVAVLRRGGTAGGASGRSARNPDLGPSGPGATGGAKVQASWAAAFKRAGVKLTG